MKTLYDASILTWAVLVLLLVLGVIAAACAAVVAIVVIPIWALLQLLWSEPLALMIVVPLALFLAYGPIYGILRHPKIPQLDPDAELLP